MSNRLKFELDFPQNPMSQYLPNLDGWAFDDGEGNNVSFSTFRPKNEPSYLLMTIVSGCDEAVSLRFTPQLAGFFMAAASSIWGLHLRPLDPRNSNAESDQ